MSWSDSLDDIPAMPACEKWIVVPCFNEAGRWNERYWADMVVLPATQWLFVDDGSKDTTIDVLTAFSSQRSNCHVVQLEANRGKAEAVRRGIRRFLDESGPANGLLAFLDADGAFTRADVALTFAIADSLLPAGEFDAVWSSRVLLKGRDIDRRKTRHYIARVVSTLLESAYAGLPYDTQSGFKVFANSETLDQCLLQPFRTRWLFEVELLIRWEALTGQQMRVWEEPVRSWRDVAGSKVAGRELMRIGRELITVTGLGRRSKRTTSDSNRPGPMSDRRARS